MNSEFVENIPVENQWLKKRIYILISGILIWLFTLLSLAYNWNNFTISVPFEWIAYNNVLSYISNWFFFTWVSNVTLGTAMILYGCWFYKSWARQLFFLSIFLMTLMYIIGPSILTWGAYLEEGNISDWDLMFKIVEFLTHVVNPILGFAGMIMVYKGSNIKNKTIFLGAGFVCLYLLITLIASLATQQYWLVRSQEGHFKVIYTGVAPYYFLDFLRPLFYSGKKLYIVILLDIAIFVAATILMISIGVFWRWIFKIMENKSQKRSSSRLK